VGIPVTPSAVRLIEWIPAPIILRCLRSFFDTRLAVVGGERQANAALDEMKEIADEFRTILRQAGSLSPASITLYAVLDARFQAVTGDAPKLSASE
jgi:hypothetical protein